MISWNYAAGWVGLFIAVTFYGYFIMSRGSVVYKRNWFPYLTVIVNVLVLLMILWTSGSSGMFRSLFLVPVLLLSSLFLIKTTKFCSGCGSGAPSYVSFRKVDCCPKCKKQFATVAVSNK